MKIAAISLVCLMLLMTFNTIAQRIDIPAFTKVSSDSIALQKQIFKMNFRHQPETGTTCLKIREPLEQRNPASIPEGVYYTAFFCRMETRLRNRTNIWIKFRVGDFDDYEK